MRSVVGSEMRADLTCTPLFGMRPYFFDLSCDSMRLRINCRIWWRSDSLASEPGSKSSFDSSHSSLRSYSSSPRSEMCFFISCADNKTFSILNTEQDMCEAHFSTEVRS
ncbi:unnamed protein product [Chondrus crispus]|uniref:Uncharacterized protein n=1 Tax=Chondrus crispus TaxID=2769 RepID=R7Q5C7_CHOCR|nr:unnamed protein product [Chondrus crispus]CDF33033.1 unnamed protein product [Chondrus crispus]|eukprot:XP_005712836.1 unnamed protein product [Chondrus crispus]